MINIKAISDSINQAVRMVTINHPLSLEAIIYRKERKSPISDKDTIGGAGIIGGIDDESEYELTCQGSCHIKFTGTQEAGEIVEYGATYSGQIYQAMIEPCNEGEFVIEKYDRVYLVLPNIQLSYEVINIKSTLSLMNGQTKLYELQPLEQSASWETEQI